VSMILTMIYHVHHTTGSRPALFRLDALSRLRL
jgi:hypothetical protein